MAILTETLDIYLEYVTSRGAGVGLAAFLEEVILSTRISMKAIVDVWLSKRDRNDDDDEEDDDSVERSHRIAFAKFYEHLWDKVRSVLVSFLGSSSSVQMVATRGLVTLSCDLIHHTVRQVHRVASDDKYNPILKACRDFLQTLLNMESTFNVENIHPTKSSWTDFIEVSEMIGRRSDGFFLQDSTEQSPRPSASEAATLEGVLPANILTKSHLLVIAPLAQTLVMTFDGSKAVLVQEMKALAYDIIEVVNIKTLTEAFGRLAAEATHLKKVNLDLRAEVNDFLLFIRLLLTYHYL